VVRRRRPLAVLCIVPAVVILLYAFGEFVDVLPTIAAVEPSVDELSLVAAVLLAAWLGIHGWNELRARSRDTFVRWLRFAGVASAVAGEVAAWVGAVRYRPTELGHFVALGGGAVALLATLALAGSAFWLRRVRAGKVRGWRVGSARGAEDFDGLIWYLPGDPFEPYELLVRERTQAGPAYRGKSIEVPIARIPSSFWVRGLDFVLPFRRSRA
jgi:hypothetical protein